MMSCEVDAVPSYQLAAGGLAVKFTTQHGLNDVVNVNLQFEFYYIVFQCTDGNNKYTRISPY